MMRTVNINVGHLFCGLGGGAKGFNRGEARVGNLQARFRCLGGIDHDAAGCADFGRLAGVKATRLDLFSPEQYRDFFGVAPPDGWREAVPDDIRHALQNEHPHILFLSAPCKGFSGLLSEKMSTSAKYQALNGLTLRGVWLALEAYKDDPVELIVFENVPRIATRGRFLLDRIVALLRAYGYAVAETTHDCGEIGGLAQSRKRFLLVARHAAKIPNFLYEPVKRPLRGVGEVLDKLPLPLSGLGGPMHRMPALHWKTWVRLAFVEAGSDWRSLNKLAVDDGVLRDFAITPEIPWAASVLGVRRWEEAAATVTGRSAPGGGAHAVADPRVHEIYNAHVLGVRQWHKPTGTVPGRSYPNNGFHSVADPRIDGHPKSVQLGVRPWDQPAGVVTGKMFAGGGPNAVADPRIQGNPRFNNVYRIVRWGDHAPAVAGSGGPGGGLAVSDPRTGFGPNTHHHVLKVTRWDKNGGTVTAAHHPAGGALCVADPRQSPRGDYKQTKYRVTGYEEAAGAVIGASSTGNGAFAVADPRYANWHPGASSTKMRVNAWDEAAGCVTGAQQVGSGAGAVADPRPEFTRNGRSKYLTAGNYGVVPWCEPCGGVTGAGQHDNGRNSVADPRIDDVLPGPSDRLVCVIRALDDTWHRPFTTLELAALQGLVDPDETLELDGLSDSAWRERIGNAVPPPAAAAIAGVMGRTLLGAWSGETFTLSSEPIWVQPIAIALMAAHGEIV